MPSVEIEQLKEAMELGAVRERNRIIALLELNQECDDEHSYYTECCNCDAIALIKGEN